VSDLSLDFPDWVPPAVRGVAIYFADQHLTSPHKLAILRRLTLDPRMKNVWAELTRRDRKTGEFFHPVRRSGSLVNRTQEQAHADRRFQ
jgi:hypothetical protein